MQQETRDKQAEEMRLEQEKRNRAEDSKMALIE